MTTTNTTASAYETGVIYEGHSMDFTSKIEYAVRADGAWFQRWQYRDPRYGYKWSTWRPSAEPTNASANYYNTKKPRLPK